MPPVTVRSGWVRRAIVGVLTVAPWRIAAYFQGPADPRDGLLVGSDRLDCNRADPAASNRMFFDTATGAFRAGGAPSYPPGSNGYALAWDLANRGASSAAFGYGCRASGGGSLASGTYTTASGQNSTACGTYATASGQNSTALGYNTSASGSYSIAAGESASASGSYSIAAGESALASGSYSIAAGSFPIASRHGQWSMASGRFAATGDAQASRFVSRKATTDATATELALDGSTAYLTIPATTVWAWQIKVVAERTDVSGTAAAWPSITGGITRDATGNCRLLGTVVGGGTTTMCDAGAATWDVTVTADATNNRLAITVTGEAAKSIRWVASIDMVEVH